MKKILYSILAGIIIIQFIPSGKSNPPVTGDIATTIEVKNILRTSCYDCHSNRTAYPWYSNIAPVSWIIANHVNEGREHLNFSEWDLYSKDVKIKLINEIKEEVGIGVMPMTGYVMIHQNAEMTEENKQILFDWLDEKLNRITISKNSESEE